MNKNYLLIIVFFSLYANAQQHKVDSLQRRLKRQIQSDTIRAVLLKNISIAYRSVEPDLGMKYADSFLTLSKKLKNSKYLFEAYQLSGLNHVLKSENDKGLAFYTKAYKVALDSKNRYGQATNRHSTAYVYSISGENKKALALEKQAYKLLMNLGKKEDAISALTSIGANYFYLADYKEASKYYFKSLKLAEEVNSPKLIGAACENIALIYKRLDNYKKSEFYYLKSLSYYNKINHTTGLINVYNNYGALKDQQGNPKAALNLYKKGMKIAVNDKNIRAEYSLLSNIAISELALKEYQKAIIDFKKTLQFFKETNDIRNTAIMNQYYVDAIMEAPDTILKEEGINPAEKYDTAIALLKPSLEYCIEIEGLDEQKSIKELLSKFYEKKGDYVNSLKEYKGFIKLKDSIYNDENRQAILSMEVQFEADKKEVLAKAEIQRQKIIKYSVIGASGILLLSGFLLFIGFRKRQIIKHTQKEILLKAKISDTELKALRLQMNPHFIFNSLNSISDYIQKNDTKKADYYLSKFGKLMRSILENSEVKEIPIAEEIKMLELYMQLEASRLNDKFSYEFKIDPAIDIENTFIPPLILQPFVENSIWHGLAKSNETGKITIEITHNNDLLNCIVEDNGVGRTENLEKKNKSFGLKITKDRLELLNKMKNTNASVNIVDLEKGTRVEVNLPFETND